MGLLSILFNSFLKASILASRSLISFFIFLSSADSVGFFDIAFCFEINFFPPFILLNNLTENAIKANNYLIKTDTLPLNTLKNTLAIEVYLVDYQ